MCTRLFNWFRCYVRRWTENYKTFFLVSGIFLGKADSVILLGFECTINLQNLIKIVRAIFEKIEILIFFLMWTTLNFRGRRKTNETSRDICKRTLDIKFERNRLIGLGYGCANHATQGKRLSPIHCCDVTKLPYLFSGELYTLVSVLCAVGAAVTASLLSEHVIRRHTDVVGDKWEKLRHLAVTQCATLAHPWFRHYVRRGTHRQTDRQTDTHTRARTHTHNF